MRTRPDGEGVCKTVKKDVLHSGNCSEPTISLANDANQSGPVIRVGHSYLDAVITEAGNHQKVARLVYVAAFAPDKGESVCTLIANSPPGAPVPPILSPADRYLFLDKVNFPLHSPET